MVSMYAIAEHVVTGIPYKEQQELKESRAHKILHEATDAVTIQRV